MMEFKLAFISSFLLILSLINFIDSIFSPCTNKSLENNIPVVSFCKEITEEYSAIVLDGYYAYSDTNMKTCTCVAKGQDGLNIDLSDFSEIHFGTGIFQTPCKSEIKVSNMNSAFVMSCESKGSINFEANGEISIVLTKRKTTADTRYCTLLQADDSSSNFSITCGGYSENVTATPTTVDTTSSPISPTTVTTDVPTTSVFVPSSPVSDDKAVQTTLSSKNEDEMLYIGVGAGCGVALVIIFIIVTVIICKRRSKIKREENGTTYQNGGHDELPYNELYISADAPVNDEQHIINVNTVMDNTAHNIEGNYSTIDLEGRPQKLKTATNPVKPVIAPKPKSKVNDSKNSHTAANHSSKQHITSPGEGGVEYAIVDKKGRVSSVEQDNVTRPPTDNTYAVVNKERKRKSSDNNTNKLKDQMPKSIEMSSDGIEGESRRSLKETHNSQYSGVDPQAPKKNTNTFMISETTNYAEIDLPE